MTLETIDCLSKLTAISIVFRIVLSMLLGGMSEEKRDVRLD